MKAFRLTVWLDRGLPQSRVSPARGVRHAGASSLRGSDARRRRGSAVDVPLFLDLARVHADALDFRRLEGQLVREVALGLQPHDLLGHLGGHFGLEA